MQRLFVCPNCGRDTLQENAHDPNCPVMRTRILQCQEPRIPFRPQDYQIPDRWGAP